tara:strand:- start:265 stop:393 length:129 start_codon:yes stop_codon:yes gene_type:complete
LSQIVVGLKINEGGIDMGKGYQAKKAVREKACDTDLFLADGV